MLGELSVLGFDLKGNTNALGFIFFYEVSSLSHLFRWCFMEKHGVVRFILSI